MRQLTAFLFIFGLLAIHHSLAQQLVVAGTFQTTQENTPLNNLGLYTFDNGGSWAMLGNGTSGQINAVAVSEGVASAYVFIGGNLQNVGCEMNGGSCVAGTGLAVNNIAKYRMDTGNWADLAGGVTSSLDASVSALLATTGFFNERLIYVGGSFTTVGSGNNQLNAINFALWNDTSESWVPVAQNATSATLGACIPTLMRRQGNNILIFSTLSENGFCFFVYNMDYDTLTDVTETAFPQLNGIGLNGFDVAGKNTYVVGDIASLTPNQTAASYQRDFPSTTKAWNPMPGIAALGNLVNIITVNTTSSIYVAGQFLIDGSQNVAFWNGSSFVSLDPVGLTGQNIIISAITVVGNTAVFGGQFTSAGNLSVSNIAIWDSVQQAWFNVAEEGLTGPVNAMAVVQQRSPSTTTNTATASSTAAAATSSTSGASASSSTSGGAASSSTASSSSSSSTSSSSSSSTTSSSGHKKSSSHSHSKKLSGGAIAGIVIGVLAGVGLIAGAVTFYYFKVRKSNATKEREGLVAHTPYGAL